VFEILIVKGMGLFSAKLEPGTSPWSRLLSI